MVDASVQQDPDLEVSTVEMDTLVIPPLQRSSSQKKSEHKDSKCPALEAPLNQMLGLELHAKRLAKHPKNLCLEVALQAFELGAHVVNVLATAPCEARESKS